MGRSRGRTPLEEPPVTTLNPAPDTWASLPAWAPAAGLPVGMTQQAILGLQGAAGNRAIGRMLSREPSAQSAPRTCPCGGTIPTGETECERCRAAGLRGSTSEAAEPEAAPAPSSTGRGRAVQREPDGGSAAAPASANAAPAAAPASMTPEDMAEMRNVKILVDEIIQIMGPAATTVIPVPDTLVGPGAVASVTPTPTPDPKVAAWPAGVPLQRSVVPETGGKAGAVHPEGGVVASIQACYDFMTGKFEVIAWVWAGAGVKTPFGWYGAYGFIEGELHVGNLGPLMAAGVCDDKCDPQEKEHKRVSGHGGVGGAGFPIDIKPGDRAVFSQGGIEIGVLFTPNWGTCSADLEVIGLFDVKKYLGPAGVSAAAAEKAAQKLGQKFGQRVECGAGFDLSVTAHLCKAKDPNAGILGFTTNSIKLCGGGFVGCNINLSRNRALLPGGGH